MSYKRVHESIGYFSPMTLDKVKTALKSSESGVKERWCLTWKYEGEGFRECSHSSKKNHPHERKKKTCSICQAYFADNSQRVFEVTAVQSYDGTVIMIRWVKHGKRSPVLYLSVSLCPMAVCFTPKTWVSMLVGNFIRRSKHVNGSKECCLLGQNTTSF